MSDDATRSGSAGPPLDLPITPATTVLPAEPTAPQGQPVGYHRATQMSPSAVPSTLESPKDPRFVGADAPPAFGPPAGAELAAEVDGVTLRDVDPGGAAIQDAVRQADAEAAMRGPASDDPAVRRHGPQTLMSPSPSGAPPPPGYGPPSNAVVDAVLPPAAFLPAGGSGGAFGMGPSGQPPTYAPGGGELAQWGAPGAHAGAFEARDPWHAPPGGQLGSLAPPRLDPHAGMPRRANVALIALIVVAAMVLLGGIAIVGGGALYLRSRKVIPTRAERPAEGAGLAPSPAIPAPTTTTTAAATGEPPPRVQPRTTDSAARAMGGTKARLSALTAGSLAIDATRSAIAAVMPRVDACFAASELEPPNHENAAYDLDVAASGIVTRVEPATQTGRAVKLDACVSGALRTARMPRSLGGSRVKVILTSRIADLQQQTR